MVSIDSESGLIVLNVGEKVGARIGMVFAVPTPLPGTIYDNMSYGLKMAGEKSKSLIDERVGEMLLHGLG